MRHAALALLAFVAAAPASAQQYWLPNGPGGTTWNNPQGSLTGTINEHMLRRHADQLRWQRERAQQPPGAAPRVAAGAGMAAADPSFRLNNTAGRTIREVYVSAATDGAWGADRLGAGVLGPGHAIYIRLPAGQCVNDLRVVFMDGQAQERRRMDTCALTDVDIR
ncbi:hypothetical protein [Falsiroseomonas sp. CW058]|uniref:hypothetical protein n=1 Tax=Falsiroseomonas sp. CW058 TaxID=3388664 RepID=UPI003D3116A6